MPQRHGRGEQSGCELRRCVHEGQALQEQRCSSCQSVWRVKGSLVMLHGERCILREPSCSTALRKGAPFCRRLKPWNVGVPQVVDRLPHRRMAKVSAVSPQGNPLVQLMLPAAKDLAAKAPGRDHVGAPGLLRPCVGAWILGNP